MPISLRLSFAFLMIAACGASVIIYSRFISGWYAITYFSWGLLITGAGLLGALILSVIATTAESRWRQSALIEIGVILILLLCLAILWKKA